MYLEYLIPHHPCSLSADDLFSCSVEKREEVFKSSEQHRDGPACFQLGLSALSFSLSLRVTLISLQPRAWDIAWFP